MDARRVSAVMLAAALLAGCGPGDGGGDAGQGEGASAPATISTQATASSTTADGGSSEEPAEVVVVISDFAFQVPDSVPAGATITVRNEDGVGHTVTSDDDGATFDVAVGPGEEATLTVPEEAGDYPFHCTPHPQMTSTLTVGG